MTESDWGSSRDPVAMLKYALHHTSTRKLQLFACACARRYWDEIDHPCSKRAVEVAERFADGLVDGHELNRANSAAGSVTRSIRWASTQEWAEKGRTYLLRSLARGASQRNIRGAILTVLLTTLNLACRKPDGYIRSNHLIQHRSVTSLAPHLCADLRDLLGSHPLHQRALDPAILAWNDRTVPHVAQSISDEHDFSSLPILADALEDAGCTDGDLLAHCRRGGRHIRGCWALDACMGRT